MSIRPQDKKLFDEFNVGVIRAREEYRKHPFANSAHGIECAEQGCMSGYRAVEAQRARRKTEQRG